MTTIVHDLRDEWCVAVTGAVRARLDGKVNPALATGEIEVVAEPLDVLNPSAPLPFPIDDQVNGRRRGPAAVPLPRPAPDQRGRARSGCAARRTASPAT